MHTIEKERVKKLFELFNSLDIALHHVGGSMNANHCENCGSCTQDADSYEVSEIGKAKIQVISNKYERMWAELKDYVTRYREHTQRDLQDRIAIIENLFK